MFRSLLLTSALVTVSWVCLQSGRSRAHDQALVPPRVLAAAPIARPEGAATPDAVIVPLMLRLDETGRLVAAALAPRPGEPAPESLFVAAALDYVHGVRFAPALHENVPVAASVRFEVAFPAGVEAGASESGSAAASTEKRAGANAEASGPGRAPPAGHVHAHAHAIVHTHEHAADEAHEEAEFGADAHVTRPERAASSYTLERSELPIGPHVLAQDLARAVPGMFVVQHAGGGKAAQYFLRGFDADHGTDVALSVDGVPVNMVSHGHGQGYADLSWVIPELIERVSVRKGPYDARDGDFATAGAIDLHTVRALPQSRLTVEGGSFRSYRALGVVSHRARALRMLGAAELMGTDGPFDREEDLKRINLFARMAGDVGDGELSLTLTGYLSGWNASGQIPLRAVRSGELDRFGSIDRNEGGSSSRHNLYVRYRSAPEHEARWELLGYATLYRFSLYSNFTLFRDDPLEGDMIHQRDQRTLSGVKARYERDDVLDELTFSSRVGLELRHDRSATGLDRAPRREWSEALVSADVEQTSLSAYAEEELAWRWLRGLAGMRADAFGFAVHDLLEDRADADTRSSGEALATRVSPKASLIVTPMSRLSVYFNYGHGFHSNDARGVVLGVTPLTRALGYEAGVSVRPLPRVRARLALFRLDLASELVWVGDEGTTEASGETRREGIEADARVELLSWLWADASATFARPRFVDAAPGEAEIPLAPRRLLSAKLTAAHPRGPFGRLAVLALADRPATEDGALRAEGFTRVDLTLGYRHPRFQLAVALENLLNARWRESQFATLSRLPQESGAEACSHGSRGIVESGTFRGCEDVHFTPGAPFAVRASASLLF